MSDEFVFKGRAWVVGDDIDTDMIYHGSYLPLTDPEEMAKHALEYVPGMEDFTERVQPGDILVAGRNFGCGSSREHAVITLQYNDVSAILAESFSRIFYRNAVNLGFPILEVPEISTRVETGDELEVDANTGRVRNLSKGTEIQGAPLSGLEKEIMTTGGLFNFLKKDLQTTE
ncbi:MAG: 3-isopropylmalate dehydratase small subunit [Anaerolineae bacterium]|nr:3-isopropylmalate dehydratase small subunit [Anaerolineae bacterium]NIN93687.1 3-isopropylmalate dehydratase small subunit [Anaerolineae bacterium]NIQ76734.1 3-isopropylmalate dehydratase small subunit [Anaerolineae bacterium]